MARMLLTPALALIGAIFISLLDFAPATSLSPVILIPGFGGSRLEYKIKGSSIGSNRVLAKCAGKRDTWRSLWVNPEHLVPTHKQCLRDLMWLEYDPNTRKSYSNEGITVRVKLGGVSDIEYLHDSRGPGMTYFAPLVERLVKMGYERDVDLIGAPYDFRKAPNELRDYFEHLKSTIERLHLSAGSKAVSLICHSLGCLNSLYFLQKVDQGWKDKHVKRLISVAAPWGGSFAAFEAAVLGHDLGVPLFFDSEHDNIVFSSFPSVMFMFPRQEVIMDEPLVRAHVGIPNQHMPLSNFLYLTIDDLRYLLSRVNHEHGFDMWGSTKNLIDINKAPEVEVWCLYGEGQKTPIRVDFEGDYANSRYRDINDVGDGLTSVASASYCKKWSRKQDKRVYHEGFNGKHNQLLRDQKLLERIELILNSPDLSRRP